MNNYKPLDNPDVPTGGTAGCPIGEVCCDDPDWE